VVTQFLGHIMRGENISLVDGGHQKRAFTYIDDGIEAMMKIIENKDGIATGKIYNIGNPSNNFSIRELADMMLTLAAEYPEYRDSAAQVKIIETTANAYYGKGYQDVQNRVPKITNTCEELGWAPSTTMPDTLRKIYDAYRGQVDLRCVSRSSRRSARSGRLKSRCVRGADKGSASLTEDALFSAHPHSLTSDSCHETTCTANPC